MSVTLNFIIGEPIRASSLRLREDYYCTQMLLYSVADLLLSVVKVDMTRTLLNVCLQANINVKLTHIRSVTKA